MEPIDLSSLVITNVYSSYRLSNISGANSVMHKRSCWALIIKYCGATEYTCSGKKYLSDKYHPIILPKGSSYSWVCIESGGFIVVQFDCDRSDERIYSFEIADCGPIMKQFLAIEKAPALYERTAQMHGKRCLYGILIYILEAGQTGYISSVQYDRLKPALAYMAEFYSNPDITNDKLAQLCKISNVYFRKLFADVFHVPPMRYLKSLRIEKAREMMKSDYSSISEIAESVGYNSVYHFSKIFKEQIGVSPQNYRIQLLKIK